MCLRRSPAAPPQRWEVAPPSVRPAGQWVARAQAQPARRGRQGPGEPSATRSRGGATSRRSPGSIGSRSRQARLATQRGCAVRPATGAPGGVGSDADGEDGAQALQSESRSGGRLGPRDPNSEWTTRRRGRRTGFASSWLCSRVSTAVAHRLGRQPDRTRGHVHENGRTRWSGLLGVAAFRPCLQLRPFHQTLKRPPARGVVTRDVRRREVEGNAKVAGQSPAGLGRGNTRRRAVRAVVEGRQVAFPIWGVQDRDQEHDQSCTVSPSQSASTAATRPGRTAARAASEGRSSGSGGVR